MIEKLFKSDKKINEFLFIIIFVYLLIFIMYIIGLTFVEYFSNVLIFDSWFYYQISLAPFKGTVAPYSYRILTPLLVYILPFKHIFSFKLINLTAIGLTGILFYYYLKELKFNENISLIGTTLLLITPTILYAMYDIALVDFLSFLFFLGAFYAILIKNDYLYFLMAVLGVFNKETIILTLPFYFFYQYGENGLCCAIKKIICISLPLLTIFLSLRYFFGENNLSLIATIQQNIYYHLNSHNMLNNPYPAFGTLWIIFVYSLTKIKNVFLKKSLISLPFIFLQLLIATDSFRVLFIAFPIVIPISLYIFQTKNRIIILILIFLSLIMLILLCLSTLKSGILMQFLLLPLEIFLLICLLFYYFYLPNIQ